MNKADVQEVYKKVSTPRTITSIEALGLKSCLFDDLFGTLSVENISDTDVYINVKSKIESLCEYALNAKSEPVAKDCNGDPICIGGTVWFGGSVRNPNGQSDSLESMRDAIQAVIDSLQKDVFDKLGEALKSPSEAQKD